MSDLNSTLIKTIAAAALLVSLGGAAALAQNVLGDDLIISGEITQNGAGNNFFNGSMSSFDGTMCVGSGCESSGESNGSGPPPLKLKWSVTDILFEDSSSSSFPDRDWRIQINGGAESFAIVDEGIDWNIGSGVTPFTIEGGAPENALWIEDDGDVGFGTNTPAMDLHIVSTDSPTVRLDQSGAGGNTPQIWDVVGNETNFFVRDQTGGTLPFRIAPGAPTNALVVASTGNIGLGTNTPEELLHIRSDTASTDAFALFDANGSGSDAAFLLRQNGTVPVTWEFRNQQSSGRLNVGIAGGNTPLKIDDGANNNLFKLGTNGQPDAVVVTGRLLVNNTQLNVPDYVFEDGYALKPLSEVRAFIAQNGHLPEVPSAAQIAGTGVDMTEMQMILLKKIEELTLYTLEQQAERADQTALIAELRATQTAQAEMIRSLQDRLAD